MHVARLTAGRFECALDFIYGFALAASSGASLDKPQGRCDDFFPAGQERRM